MSRRTLGAAALAASADARSEFLRATLCIVENVVGETSTTARTRRALRKMVARGKHTRFEELLYFKLRFNCRANILREFPSIFVDNDVGAGKCFSK